MSTRYGNRDYDRGERDNDRRSESEYDRSYGERYRSRSKYGRDEDEREGYGGESRWRGQYGRGGESNRGQYGGGEYNRGQYGGGRSSGGSEYSGGRYDRSEYGGGSRSRSEDQYRRREHRPGSENDWDYTDQSRSRYGNIVRGYDTGQYDDTSSGYSSQRYNYPTGFRSGESYEERRGGSEYDYDRGGYGEERGWLDRVADKLAAWFGDEEAQRRQRMDDQRQYHGKGPKSYRRSDERIREDVNDRLSEGYLDATDIEVRVSEGLVTLTGTVNSRTDKHRAEDIADDVRGVKNVENRLRVERSNIERYPSVTGTSSTTGATGTTGTTGTTGITGTADTSSSATTGSTGTARGRTAGSQS